MVSWLIHVFCCPSPPAPLFILAPLSFIPSINPSTSPETTTWSKSMVSVATTSSGWETCLLRALRMSRQSYSQRRTLQSWKRKLQMDWLRAKGTREQQRGDIILITRRAALLCHSTPENIQNFSPRLSQLSKPGWTLGQSNGSWTFRQLNHCRCIF